MVHLLGAIIGMLIIGMLVVSVVFWGNALVRLATGKPLLPVEPRRPVPWGMVDLAFIFFAVLFMVVGGQLAAQSLFDIPQNVDIADAQSQHLAVALFSSSLAMLASCAVAVGILMLRGATGEDLGWQSRRLLDDLRLGTTAFVMLAPPMYLLQFVLTRIWPSEHPIQTLLLEDPDVSIIVGAAFTAVIVAPLTEEIFFRLILQGWLEKFSVLAIKLHSGSYDLGIAGSEQARCDSRAVFLGDSSDQPFPNTVATGEEGDATSEVDGRIELDHSRAEFVNAYVSPQVETQKVEVTSKSSEPGNPTPQAWPIFVSAAIFALLHWGHGPDPVPLFLLAVGLGYLYHRTHRILPCIVVHFLVNSLSMTALIMYLLTGGEPP